MMSSPEQAIEAVYPLSSAQEGILFHSSLSPDEGIYLTQRLSTLPSNLDIEPFKDAWRQVIQRHTILRTAFLFGTIEKSLQVVGRRAQFPWAEEDWRQQPADAEPELLNTVLKADRMRGFELTRAPMMRFRLLRRRDGSYYLLWSFHHAILDGWSYPLVLKEVDALYTAACQGHDVHLPAAQPYQSYIAWLQRQDLGKA